MFKTGIAFRLKAHIEKSIFARVDHFLVLSRFNKNILIEEFRISPQNITIIPSGVNTERFIPTGDKKSAKAALGIPADLRVLLTVRRLTARMGLEDLVRAMRTVVQERRALLIIGGTGHLKNRLMSLVNEYDLADNIEFAGHIPEKNLPLYYQAADLFVLPSLCYEGFGLVTLEALSSGLPIIGTATGGTNEILASLDPQLLVEAARPDILAQKIITILDSKEYDPNTLHQFAEDNHSWNAIFPRIETLFAKTTGSI
jgi:glycosyltransferase involved in cell wall biosynthesis